MNSTLAKYAFFYPVRLITGQNISHYLTYVKKIETLGAEELKHFQWQKLKQLLTFARDSIPYYSRVFKSNNIKLEDIRNSEDLLRIPSLSKQMIQEDVELFKNPHIKKHYKRTTSGSQGTPLTFFKDRHSLACMDAVMYHAYNWHGITLGDPQARFWGMPLSPGDQKLTVFKDFLMNRIRLSAFDLSVEAFEKYYAELKRFRPRYFYGYPSLMYEFALFIKEFKKDISFLNLKGMIGTGELVLSQQRSVLEHVFNCPFIDEYGCTEAGVLGFDCTEGNMHLMAHNIYMEVIKDGQHVYDEEGEIYITELNTFTFPFIRYKLGDLGIISTATCKCGRSLPLVRISTGRIDSYILTPSGGKIYDAVLAYTLKKGITAFKAIQTSLNQIEIYVQVNKDFSEELQEHYISALQEKIDSQINIVMTIVEELPRETSGKLRYFVPLSRNKQVINTSS